MLRSVKELAGYAIRATDGDFGKGNHFLFDDTTWTVRYLVVITGYSLSGRLALVSPAAIGKADNQERVLPVSLTKEQIRSSPDIDTDMPVFRQQELALARYYGWPSYWGGDALVPQAADEVVEGAVHTEHDPHLRSAQEVMSYHVQARDGELGHVEDFLVDDETWSIRYLVLNTRNWWRGKKVLVAPARVQRINWAHRKVYLDLSREEIRSRPELDCTEHLAGASAQSTASIAVRSTP